MRIAYICADPGIPVFGTKGASVHIQEIVRAFRRRGDDVTVYCSRRGEVVPADLADLSVVEIAVRAPDAAGREIAIASTAQLLAAAVIADGCDLAYERYSLFSAAAGLVKARLAVPVVLEVNAPLIEEQRTHRVLADEIGAVTATRQIIAAADVVACVSQAVATWVTDLSGGTAITRTVVVPNGVNTSRITPAVPARPGTPSRVFTVGFVGTLKPWHGVDVLLRAAAAAATASRARHGEPQRWRLVIAGAGPEHDALRALAADLLTGSDTLDIEFTGAVAPERIPHLLRGFDVAVAPYPLAETADQYFSPLKVYEYLAAGLPVVASAIGQIPAIIDHDSTGLLVAPGDERALSEALLELQADPDRRRRLGEAGRTSAVTHHDWTAVLARALAPLVGPVAPLEKVIL
ncbi:glycosyltransferase family 1 protein [Cryobacterium frigoriphilum]|uniref:D-inositol 3-phosphate glycosyltransferase n=1 Tax=Cryobacterium frigoriphilum TaxID=1259150 RepID=A0A4R8ZYR1_9MICO|nr:glycosyltransferase family 4 protein [Cryobacterium frigoriphilum]TFD48947.1 glycosyltransferase family 1 protein [Cryobacterium frigoriphilum]